MGHSHLHITRNKQGSALIGVLSMMAVSSVLILGMNNMITYANKGKTGEEISQQVGFFRQNLLSILNDPVFCTSFLSRLSFTTAQLTNGSSIPVQLPALNLLPGNTNGTLTLQPGTMIGNYLKIQTLELNDFTDLIATPPVSYSLTDSGPKFWPKTARLSLVLNNLAVRPMIYGVSSKAFGPPTFSTDIVNNTDPSSSFIPELSINFVLTSAGTPTSLWTVLRCLPPTNTRDGSGISSLINDGWQDQTDTTNCKTVTNQGTDNGVNCDPNYYLMNVTPNDVSDLQHLTIKSYICCKVPSSP